jgi:hypothetical protein
MTTAEAPRTIPRNATRKIREIQGLALSCQVFTLDRGFIGHEVDPKYAWEALATYDFARLTARADRWTVRVHSNLWYELRRRTN